MKLVEGWLVVAWQEFGMEGEKGYDGHVKNKMDGWSVFRSHVVLLVVLCASCIICC